MPQNGKVILHGHTDVIGEEANNHKLSLARAKDVRTVLENSLLKASRTDVTLEVFGFGEDQSLSPFRNKNPDECFYNRTVIMDSIPGK